VRKLSVKEKEKMNSMKGTIDMKTTLIAVACALLVPFAFAQASSTSTHKTATKQVNTRMNSTRTVETLESLDPASSITVSSSAITQPATYALGKDVRFQTAHGATISPNSIQPGASVRLNFNARGKVDRVIVVERS
jgi:hypothetical protein